MARRYGDIDYPTLTKRSVLLGLALFSTGALGELAVHAAGLRVPAWEMMLLFDMEVLGVVILLVSPFLFGVFLPLTE